MTSLIDQDLTNDNVVVSVEAMNLAAHLDTMDSVINGSRTNQCRNYGVYACLVYCI